MLTEEASKRSRLRSELTADWRVRRAELFENQQQPLVVYGNEQQGLSVEGEEEEGKEVQDVRGKLTDEEEEREKNKKDGR